MEEHLPFPLGAPTAGGLSVWLSGPAGFDGTRVAQLARERGVLVDPGERFFLADVEKHHLRVGFNAIALEAIPRGIEILGKVVRAQLDE